MEILPNIHQIDVPFAGRTVSVYVLIGEQPLLIDSGVATSPACAIFPSLRQVGLLASDLHAVVNTHAHADHCGGNHELKRANPHLLVMAHERECQDVQDPVSAVHAFFDPYRDVIGDTSANAGINWNKENLGPGTIVDLPLHDQDRLRLASNWQLEVHHTPGHTPGHLSLFDPQRRTAFIGDAVGWKGSITAGHFTQFHSYFDVDAYLNTIGKVRSWRLDYLGTSHYSVLRGDEIDRFLDESEEFVLDLDRITKLVVGEMPTPFDLGRVTKAVLKILGGSYQFDICSVFCVEAHLKHLGR